MEFRKQSLCVIVALFCMQTAAEADVWGQCQNSSNSSAAIRDCTKIIKTDGKSISFGKYNPDNLSMVYRLRGDAYQAAGNCKSAISDYTKAISLSSNDGGKSTAKFYRAQCYITVDKIPEAKKDLQYVVKHSPSYASGFLAKAKEELQWIDQGAPE